MKLAITVALLALVSVSAHAQPPTPPKQPPARWSGLSFLQPLLRLSGWRAQTARPPKAEPPKAQQARPPAAPAGRLHRVEVSVPRDESISARTDHVTVMKRLRTVLKAAVRTQGTNGAIKVVVHSGNALPQTFDLRSYDGDLGRLLQAIQDSGIVVESATVEHPRPSGAR